MKKIMSILTIIVLSISIMVLPVSAQADTYTADNTAKELTATNKISISDGTGSAKLSDSNRTTKLTLKKDTVINVSNVEEMSCVYIIWDKPVGEWELKTPTNTLTCGKNDYIHEYISLPVGTKEFSITIPQDGTIICDIYTFATGKMPDWVQIWTPPYTQADLLVMPTHGDDEFIFFGGTIPYYAVGRNLRVQVAYMTNHWGEPYRPHEMLNSLWVSGLKNYPVMGRFPDIYSTSLEHAKKVYNYKDVVGYNVELIRRFKPKVIVGHDLNGEYGHGGHMINAHALADAVTISEDAAQYPESAQKYGVWDVPKTYLHLYEKNNIRMNWDEPIKGFGGKSSFEMAVEAFACHKSQQKWYSVRKTTGVYDCQSFGLYRSLVGEDTAKNDFFENISFKEPEPESLPDSSVADENSSADKDSTSDSLTADNNGHKVKAPMWMIIVFAGAFLIALDILIAVRMRSHKK